jgi:type VI protein secretion system component VasK
VKRYYKRKITEISKEIEEKFGEITAERILAVNGGDIGFIEGSYIVPGAYTREGNQLMKTAISEGSEKLKEDDWVMGEQDVTEIAQSTDTAALVDIYYRDYAEQWKAFVKGLKVKSYDKQNAGEALRVFSSANSPTEILVREIARQTNLSAEPEPRSWWEWIKSFFQKPQNDKMDGNSEVEREFRPLFAFVSDDKNGNSPIERYRTEISRVAIKFSSFSSTDIDQISKDLANSDHRRFPELKRSQTNTESLLRGFNETPTAQELAGFMKTPLDNLLFLLVSSKSVSFEKTWREVLLPRAKEIEKGYPFAAGDTDADLIKVNAFLNPLSGDLSRFYENSLKNNFEEFDGELKFKESGDAKINDEFTKYLNNTFRLRKALYSENSPVPKFVYEFKLKPVKDTVIEIVVDGQTASSKETSSVRMTFPASAGEKSGVLMKCLSTGSEIKWEGTWGLFKFFDAGSPVKQPTGEYLLTYEIEGKTVMAIVKPSVADLFDKNIFKSVRAPDLILK